MKDERGAGRDWGLGSRGARVRGSGIWGRWGKRGRDEMISCACASALRAGAIALAQLGVASSDGPGEAAEVEAGEGVAWGGVGRRST